MRKKSSTKPRPNSCIVPHFKSDPKPRCRPTSYREPDTCLHAENMNYCGCESHKHTFPQLSVILQNLEESLGRLDPVIEETDQHFHCRTNSSFDQPLNAAKAWSGENIQEKWQDNQHSDTVQTVSALQKVGWLTSNVCSQEVKIGLRKDVYPESSWGHGSAGGSGDLPSNKRFSIPESQILLLQDSYRTDVLSLCYNPDLITSSVPCLKSAGHDTPVHRQLVSQSSCQAARPLTYPNNQSRLHIDPVACTLTQSESPSSHSSKVFMQTHL